MITQTTWRWCGGAPGAQGRMTLHTWRCACKHPMYSGTLDGDPHCNTCGQDFVQA
jgi:hypothetical protein